MRRSLPTPVRPRAATALGLVLLIVTGCGTSATVPDGWTRLERDAYALALPPGWSVSGEGGATLAATGTAESDGVTESLSVQVDPTATGDIEAVVEALIQPFRLRSARDYAEVGRRDVEVPGAAEATVVEATYLPDDAEVPLRAAFLVALSSDGGPLVVVHHRAPEPVWDPETSAAVIEAVELRS